MKTKAIIEPKDEVSVTMTDGCPVMTDKYKKVLGYPRPKENL